MTIKAEYQRAIRQHCLNCCGGSKFDVENCTSGPDASPYSTCELWTFRLGKDPNKNPNKVEAAKRSNNLGIKPKN